MQSFNTTAHSGRLTNSPVVKITVHDGERELRFVGREAHTLSQLLERGPQGLSSVEQIGPRISHYVMKLRQAGLVVETVKENHAGAFRGWHARYVLHTPLRVIEIVRAGDKGARNVAA